MTLLYTVPLHCLWFLMICRHFKNIKSQLLWFKVPDEPYIWWSKCLVRSAISWQRQLSQWIYLLVSYAFIFLSFFFSFHSLTDILVLQVSFAAQVSEKSNWKNKVLSFENVTRQTLSCSLATRGCVEVSKCDFSGWYFFCFQNKFLWSLLPQRYCVGNMNSERM